MLGQANGDEATLPASTRYHASLLVPHRPRVYSVRKARIGSNPAAIRAGSSAAKNAAAHSTNNVTDKISGS